MTTSELSDLVRKLRPAATTTPFTVSRPMSEWPRTGLLGKSQGKVLLRSSERLLMQDF